MILLTDGSDDTDHGVGPDNGPDDDDSDPDVGGEPLMMGVGAVSTWLEISVVTRSSRWLDSPQSADPHTVTVRQRTLNQTFILMKLSVTYHPFYCQSENLNCPEFYKNSLEIDKNCYEPKSKKRNLFN